jgi:preprotein translocase subunit SecA
VLEGEDLGSDAREEVGKVITRMVDEYTPGDFVEEWDVDGLIGQVEQIFPVEIDPARLAPDQIERGELTELLAEAALELYERREQELGEELMRALERYLLLEIIDQRWREHLYDMDYLREGIHLRGFAQIEPIVAYKNEAFELFTDLMNGIWADFARMIFNVDVQIEGDGGGPGAGGPSPVPPRPGPGSSSTSGGRVSYSGGGQIGGREAIAMASAEAGAAADAYADGQIQPDEMPIAQPVEQRRVDESEQIGRNDPCWCGSGKKFKKCHGA